jgi:hypothetical protein
VVRSGPRPSIGGIKDTIDFLNDKVVSPLDKNGKCLLIESLSSYVARMHKNILV